MPHPLDEWLPNDAPWATLPLAVLKKQCAVRNLPTTGHTWDLVQRLSAYSQANTNTSDIIRRHPWRPSYQPAEMGAEKERFQIVRVVDKPGRKGDSLRRDFQICDHRLWPESALETRKPITVSIDTALKCDCSPQVRLSLFNFHCAHIIYILRFVLNCPVPYRWQRALLPSELQTIYQHSHAIRALRPNNSGTQTEFCIFCFQGIDKDTKELVECRKCSRRMHWACSLKAKDVRNPERISTCWICYDNVEWNIEKFCWHDRVIPAAPSTAPAVPAQIGPAIDAIQESIQRKEPKDDDFESSSSSSDEDSEDEQPSNTQITNRRFPSILSSSSSSSSSLSSVAATVKQQVPPSAHRRGQPPRESKTKALQAIRESRPLSTSVQTDESIPLPGIPALIWQEMREQREQREKQREKARQQAALPQHSLSLGHALRKPNPGGGKPSEVTVSRNAARTHTSTRASSSAAETPASTAITATPQHNQAGATSISGHDASVADAVSQAPQSGVTTASLTEPAGATGAQDTISTPAGDNPASASAPVPPDHSASAPTHAHSGTQTTIDHTKALELVQECSRLAKKSVQIRKKSEREAKRMEKKHRRELKNITKIEKKHRLELKKITKIDKKHRRELKKMTKMEKKHRRELKKTKRKSKQEVDRLEKKIESLEKEALKALARPEVAEGPAA